MRVLATFVAAIVTFWGAGPSQVRAQDWPAKPIRLIVPFPPGGGTDIMARVLGAKLSESLKQQVVIDNKPGAGGNIGVDLTAKAPADGYTMVLGQTSNLAINPTLYPRLPYDPVKDLVAVGLVAEAPIAVVVNAGSKLTSLQDLISAAKANPGALNFGSPGNGTVAHLAGELVQRTAGIKLLHIPYKGSAQALTDLLGGRLDVFMSSVPTALGQIKAGKLRALAVSTTKRSASLPDTPTIAQTAIPNFDAATWWGVLMPAGTRPQIVERLNRDINLALDDADLRSKIASEGGGVRSSTPAEFASLVQTEIKKWGEVVKASGAKVD